MAWRTSTTNAATIFSADQIMNLATWKTLPLWKDRSASRWTMPPVRASHCCPNRRRPMEAVIKASFSVRVKIEEIAALRPEQQKAFLIGVAEVMNANNGHEPSVSKPEKPDAVCLLRAALKPFTKSSWAEQSDQNANVMISLAVREQ